MIEDIEDAITLSMKEASMAAEVEANEQRLKWAWELIENRGKKQAMKQGRKLSRSERKQAITKE